MKTHSGRFHGSWQSLLTSGFGSALLHTAIFIIVGFSFRGCQKTGSGEAGGEPFGNVGLWVVDGHEKGAADKGLEAGAGADQFTQQAMNSSNEADDPDEQGNGGSSAVIDRLPAEAPNVSQLFTLTGNNSTGGSGKSSTLPEVMGPGNPIGGRGLTGSGGTGTGNRATEAGGAARMGGPGGSGQTTFMDIAGVGKTFVYVIDTSSSMHGSRLKIAQGQLKASLRLLQPNQKFAVIFYNEYRERLKLRRQPEQSMYFATELNKQLASQEVDRITSDRGTDHKPAMIEALSLKPDVVFFLTDGDEPELSAADLKEIARFTGNSTIHVIKFGDGTIASREATWLERLARQGGGEFREIKAAL